MRWLRIPVGICVRRSQPRAAEYSEWRADLKDTVIVLPRVVPQVNDLSPEDFRTDDPRAATLPSLPEWTTLPDKVRGLLACDFVPDR